MVSVFPEATRAVARYAVDSAALRVGSAARYAPRTAVQTKRPALPPAVSTCCGSVIYYSRWCLPCMHLPAATVWLCPRHSVIGRAASVVARSLFLASPNATVSEFRITRPRGLSRAASHEGAPDSVGNGIGATGVPGRRTPGPSSAGRRPRMWVTPTPAWPASPGRGTSRTRLRSASRYRGARRPGRAP